MANLLLVDTEPLFNILKTKFLQSAQKRDFLSQNKWAYAHLALDSENKPTGCVLSCLSYSTWKGVNLGIDFIDADDEKTAGELYKKAIDFAKDCNLTQARFYAPFPLKYDWEKFGSLNLTVREDWDILELDIDEINKLANREIKLKGDYTLKPASKDDAKAFVDLCVDLAVYENMKEDCWMTEEIVTSHAFDQNNKINKKLNSIEPVVNIWVAIDNSTGKTVGYSCCCPQYNKEHGRYVYLEDLYVDSEHRGKGIGLSMMQNIAKWALANECKAYRWACLGWNEGSLSFYYSLGAKNLVKTDQVRMFREDYGAIKDDDKEAWLKIA